MDDDTFVRQIRSDARLVEPSGTDIDALVEGAVLRGRHRRARRQRVGAVAGVLAAAVILGGVGAMATAHRDDPIAVPATSAAVDPTVNPSSTPTATVGDANVLTSADFTRHGFVEAKIGQVTPEYQETPECGVTKADSTAGFVNLKRLAVTGAHTEANELVVQFHTTEQASTYVDAYVAKIEACEKTVPQYTRWQTSKTAYPGVGAAQAETWTASYTSADRTRWNRTIGVARTGQRVTVLELQSATNKPWQVIDTDGLLTDAVTRLQQ